MQRPEVRIVQGQSEENRDQNLDGYEAQALLAKYGFNTNYNTANNVNPVVTDTRSFEEIVTRQEQERLRQAQQVNRPRAITFDDRKTAWSETKWSSLEDDSGNNFGIQVTIVSDHKI